MITANTMSSVERLCSSSKVIRLDLMVVICSFVLQKHD